MKISDQEKAASVAMPMLKGPARPLCPDTSADTMRLASIRDYASQEARDPAVARRLIEIIDSWHRDKEAIEPLRAIQAVIDSIRIRPRGDRRLSAMNALVRTLGRADRLATLLDMLSEADVRGGAESEIGQVSAAATQHCIYGWCGQTLLVASNMDRTEGTVEAEPGVREMLGGLPPTVWGLSMHIWQPNPRARGFASGRRDKLGTICEPPHSHPFDFASMVAKGELRQSLYAQRDPSGRPGGATAGRYGNVPLDHVHGVWPPHVERCPAAVETIEERVLLKAGDSYFMPSDRIHDVEVDAATAAATPAITLFLAAEAVVKPHVYMAPAMTAYHEANPDLKQRGEALPVNDWKAKLGTTAAYLRGESPALDLRGIVRYEGEYAFFHA